MKMIMIICPENREEEIHALIEKHDIHAYSAIRDVIGAGKTGKRMDSHVWPGKSILIFAIVDDPKIVELSAALKDCQENLMPTEGMRSFVLAIESMI